VSRATAAGTELRRALWRHGYGQLSSTRMQELLEEAYEDTTRGFAALEDGVPAARRHSPELLAVRDGFRARAHTAIRGERFRDAVDEILLGQRALADLRALVEACDRIGEAAAAVRRLADAASAPRLHALPCIAAPARLLALACEHLERKRYAQVTYLAAAARAECAPLERRERAESARVARLEARLAEIRVLCAETRELSGGEADPLADGALDAAAALARDGFLTLAERVADELAFSLAARDRFRRELRRAGEASPEDTALLRSALAGGAVGDAWSSATAALWRSRVEAGLRRVDEQRERLDRAHALLLRNARATERPSARADVGCAENQGR
jgi:hypothetical protein